MSNVDEKFFAVDFKENNLKLFENEILGIHFENDFKVL